MLVVTDKLEIPRRGIKTFVILIHMRQGRINVTEGMQIFLGGGGGGGFCIGAIQWADWTLFIFSHCGRF